jgi:succinoglycan biosynthesis protein ExoA
VAPVGYVVGVLAASVVERRDLSPLSKLWLPAVLATMHLSWGAGFLVRKAR